MTTADKPVGTASAGAGLDDADHGRQSLARRTMARIACRDREVLESVVGRIEELISPGSGPDADRSLADRAERVVAELEQRWGSGAGPQFDGTELAAAAAAVAGLQEITTEQTTFLHDASGAADRMQSSIVENSRLAQTASTAASELSTRTGERTTQILSVVSRLQSSAEQASGSLSTIFDLGDSSSQIAGLARSIDDIAGQTKILALNAAISAARAGDKGQEFSVISREIRKLATRAAETAGDITRLIDDLQTKMRGAAEAMQQVDVGLEDVDHAGDSLNGIAADTGHLVDSVDQISRHSRSQSAATSDVLFGIDAAVMTGERLVENLAQVADFISGLKATSLSPTQGIVPST